MGGLVTRGEAWFIKLSKTGAVVCHGRLVASECAVDTVGSAGRRCEYFGGGVCLGEKWSGVFAVYCMGVCACVCYCSVRRTVPSRRSEQMLTVSVCPRVRA